MSRPALAAARGARILDFLAAFPERRFTLTDIAGATGINRASCLAILGELEQRAYLHRHATRKTYWLGPALMALGASAAIANPLLSSARGAAERLRDEFGLPVLLSTQIGDEIMCVFSLCDHAGRTAGLRAGDRVPLVPPIGISFVAWSRSGAADEWIARRAGAEQVAQGLREAIALTKERGYQVTLRRPGTEDIASIFARAAAGERTHNLLRQVAAFVETLDLDAAQPDTLDNGALHDVQLIAAPVIDQETSAIYNLCLGGFTERMAGTEIAKLGRRLTAACLDVMRGLDRI